MTQPTLSRRSVLKSLFAGSVILQSPPLWASTPAKVPAGKLYTDYGNLVTKRVPGELSDLARAQSFLAKNERIHPRGAGHSGAGQSLREGAWVFSAPDIPMRLLDGDRVEASGSAFLAQIDAFLDPHRRMLPTIPDAPGVTLGGVLSVGGFGHDTTVAGALVDHVLSLTLLTPQGEIVADLKPGDDLFHQVLCGFGEHGTILSAQLRTVEKQRFTKIDSLYFGEAAAHIAETHDDIYRIEQSGQEETIYDIWWSSWSAREKRGAIRRGTRFYDGDTLPEMTSFRNETHGTSWVKNDYRAHRMKDIVDWSYHDGAIYNVWCDLIMTLDMFDACIHEAHRIADRVAALGADSYIYSVCGTNRYLHPKQTNAPHYFPEGTFGASIGIFSQFGGALQQEARRSVDWHIDFAELAIAQGARPYRYCWYDRSQKKALSA